MAVLVAGVALLIIVVVLWDAFETIVLPRRVPSRLRLTHSFYRATWRPWSALARRLPAGRIRENFLSAYGPLSLILLLGVWALGLILGFGMLQWALGSPLSAPEGTPTFGTYVYLSGTTFFTLGLGDVTPLTRLARSIIIVEAGTGFAFLGAVVGYLPVLYQAFSRREVNISLLDARAGSPPSAVELLRRYDEAQSGAELGQLLRESERWAAELLESHLSYPVLAYYRSQHERESWLAALTALLDVSALVMARGDPGLIWQARLTFAMARHTAVDLAQLFSIRPRPEFIERLPPDDLTTLPLLRPDTPASAQQAGQRLAELRALYEPYVNGLSAYLQMPLPPWLPAADSSDNWEQAIGNAGDAMHHH